MNSRGIQRVAHDIESSADLAPDGVVEAVDDETVTEATTARRDITPAIPPSPKWLSWILGITPVIALWLLTPVFTDYIPSLSEVSSRASDVLSSRESYSHVWATFRRLAVGLTLGYSSALVAAILMSKGGWGRRFFLTYVFLTLSLPSLAVSLFSLMIFGLLEVGVYVAIAVIVFPFVVLGLQEGFATLDARLGDMGHIYRLNLFARIRHVALPEISPFLFSAFRNAHSLGWKVAVIAEVFSQDNGIGYQYKRAYDFFQLDLMVVWILFFVVAVFGVEYGVVRPLERRVLRWRKT